MKNRIITTIKGFFRGDKVIWAVFILLTLISLVAVYSSIGLSAVETRHSTPFHAFSRHAYIVVFSYLAVLCVSHIPYRRFSMMSKWGYIGITALLAVMVFVLRSRWIAMPIIGQFQPSEVAKIILVLFLARQLTLNRETIQSVNTYWRLIVIIALNAIFILPENFSTAALVLVISMIMLYFGGLNRKYWFRTILVILAVGGIGIGIAYNSYRSGKYTGNEDGILARASTWGHRVDSWIHPNPEELSQENMARMAVASGRFFGVGIGNTVHARLMTQADNDFIFAIIIEEKGMAMGLLVFFLYNVLFFRCLRLAKKCKGLFGSLILVGYGSLFYIQALLNMLVAVGMMPVTGQTLPLISSGGTAYLFMSCAIGVIQSVAHDVLSEEKRIRDKRRDDAEFEEIKKLGEQLT